MSEPPPAGSRIGVVIDGRYRLDAVLGVGGFGAVYRARHLELDDEVALKLLHADSGDMLIKRLRREAKTLARLDHPNCVRVRDYGSHAGAAYLVMELIEGEPLSAALGQPWPQRQALARTIELLAGLAHAHELGLVHRDLKPANVLLGAQLKIIDFGIVAIAAGEQLASFTEQLTATGRIIGTPRYMSPEQLLGAKIDGRSDLYAVGLLLYEMLAGEPAFASEDPRELAWRHAVAPPPLLPDRIDDELAALVGQLLAKKPSQRPASAQHLREQLRALLVALEQVALEQRSPPTPSPTFGTTDTLAPPVAPTTELPPELGATLSSPTLLTQELEVRSAESERRAGRFTLLRELGRGAMGVVYLGWDEALDRQAAIKLLRPGQQTGHAHQRMLREARGLARVEHPNVVGVQEFGTHADQLFVAMEYVPGRTLRAWLSERERDWPERLARVLEAGRGLAAVHAAGLVHRDFKPDNVLIGDDERARVVDFGLVRAVSPAFDMVDRLAGKVDETQPLDPLALKLTRTGAIIGTPAYMALEQLAGDQVDARTDQFAFCVVAYEALYGRRPFVGHSLEDLAAKLTAGQLEPRPEHCPVPPALDEVLARGLQIMPASRWSSMDALLDALERAAQPAPRVPSWVWAAGLVGVAGLALAGLVWLGAARRSARSEDPAAGPALASASDPGPPRRELDDERERARLARAYPSERGSWRDILELAARAPQPMSVELRAAVHALAGAVHERDVLRELGKVEALAWAPDEPLLALALDSGALALWDAEARELRRELAGDRPLESLSFSPEGELLAGRARGGAVSLWHVSTGTRLALIEQPEADFIGFVVDASAPRPSPSLVIGSDEEVSLWSLVRGKELERAASIFGPEPRLALACAGARVLAVSEDGRARTWTLSEQSVDEVALEAFDGSKREPLALSPDAAHILRAAGGELELWDARTGARRVIDTLGPCSGALAFAPDSKTVVVGRRARAPLHIELDTGARLDSAASASVELRGLGVDAHARLLTLQDGGRLEIASAHHAASVPGLEQGRALALAPIGERVALLDEEGVASVWASVSVARSAAGPAPVDEQATSPVGVNLSGAWPTRVQLSWTDGRARVLELEGELRACAVSADEALLACAGVGPRVELWSLASGARSRVLHLDEHELHALSFAPDSARLAIAGRELHLWDLDAGVELARFAPTRPVRALAFRSEGQALELGYADGQRELRLVDERALLAALCRADPELEAELSACESP